MQVASHYSTTNLKDLKSNIQNCLWNMNDAFSDFAQFASSRPKLSVCAAMIARG